MPVFDRFTPTLERTPPAAYAIPASDTTVVRLIRLHGLAVERSARDWRGDAESFVIDSIAGAARPFQGHRETRITGAWRRENLLVPAGSFIVRPAQARGILAVYLLEPESDDGLTDWNFFDSELARGKAFPVLRLLAPPPPGTAISN
jgi:hypothetical protein